MPDQEGALGQTIGLNFAATGPDVRRSLVVLGRLLSVLGLAPADIGNAEIVLGEVMNNIVEHACANIPDGRIDLTVRYHAMSLAFQIKDNGKELPEPSHRSMQFPGLTGAKKDLPEGGFGWALIDALVSQMVYSRHGGENTLSIVMPTAAPVRLVPDLAVLSVARRNPPIFRSCRRNDDRGIAAPA